MGSILTEKICLKIFQYLELVYNWEYLSGQEASNSLHRMQNSCGVNLNVRVSNNVVCEDQHSRLGSVTEMSMCTL